MATNIALQIPEILIHIVSHLGRSNDSLLSIALTSKLFSEVALDSIWAQLQSPQPLFNLIPGVEWVAEVLVCPDTTSLASNARFNIHRRRVRALHWTVFDEERYDPLLLSQIACLPDGLFPCLKRLAIFHQLKPPFAESFLTLLPALILPSSCVSFSLSSTYDPEITTTTTSLAKILSNQSPRMTTLSFSHLPLREHVMNDLLAECHCVTTLELRVVSFGNDTLRVLGRLENLRSLSLESFQPSLPGQRLDLTGPPATSFSQLKALILEMSPYWTAQVLSVVSSTTLTRAHLTISRSNIDSDILMSGSRYLLFCFSRITRSANHLRILKITLHDVPSPTPQLECLAHFFNLPCLVYCAFRLPAVALTSEDVYKMAIGWPGLKVLNFGRTDWAGSSTLLPPLHSLQAFAKHCPNLKILRLAVADDQGASNVVDVENATAGPIIRGHPLTELDLSYSHITAPAEAARTIRNMFPNITSFGMANEIPEKMIQTLLFGVSA